MLASMDKSLDTAWKGLRNEKWYPSHKEHTYRGGKTVGISAVLLQLRAHQLSTHRSLLPLDSKQPQLNESDEVITEILSI